MGSPAADLLRSTHVSYSKLQTYEQCPEKFKLQYLDGFDSKPSRAIQIGSVVHAVLAEYLESIQGHAEVFQPDVAELAGCIPAVCRQLREDGELLEWIEDTELLPYLRNFVKLMPRIDGRAIVSVEETMHTRIGSWVLKSILDLVLTNAKGEVHLIDFKTGKPEYVHEFQLRTYALPILGSPTYGVPGIKASYVFLKGSTLRSFRVSQADCDEIVSSVTTVIRRIEADDRFVGRVSSLCRWCGVRQYCSSC